MLHGLSANQPLLQYRDFRMAVKAAFGQWIILRAGLSTDTGFRAGRDFMDGEKNSCFQQDPCRPIAITMHLFHGIFWLERLLAIYACTNFHQFE